MKRRDFIKLLAAMGATTALGGHRRSAVAGNPRRPNFLVIITDQERQHMHWPKGLAQKQMPSWQRLRKNGVTFNRAYCSATQCSPSRACILTGQYSNINKVPYIGYPACLPDKNVLPNIGSWLAEKAGYEVVWKGKWHLSFPVGFKGGLVEDEVWTGADITAMADRYGLTQWDPPDAGTNVLNTPGSRATMGGGWADNDGRYMRGMSPGDARQTPGYGMSALDYIGQLGATPKQLRRPFCLFVSLVNPHDIAYFPNGWQEGGYDLARFKDLGVGLPPNFRDNLATKPSVQKKYYDYLNKEGPLGSEADQLNYVNFYAHLHGVVNGHIEALLDAMDEAGLTRDTIIIRTADHGELGLSHGLREKAYVAYNEALHVPLTISNPELFPRPVSTDALYSHVDLAATMAELAGVPGIGVGKSQVPVLLDPGSSVRRDVLFAYDDHFFLPLDTPSSHIRALVDARHTYAAYYSADGGSFEYEMYDNISDPYQMDNLAFKPSSANIELMKALHGRLTQSLEDNLAQPEGFEWPASPVQGGPPAKALG